MRTGAYDKYDMMYCDAVKCRVNTFEYGVSGMCPGCSCIGQKIGQS